MTVNQNSWHYDLWAQYHTFLHKRYPERTNLCRYFWTVFGTVVLGYIVGPILKIVFYYAIGYSLYAIGIALSFIFGLKMKNIDSDIALRSFQLAGRKIYPLYIWLTLAGVGLLRWAFQVFGMPLVVWVALAGITGLLGWALCLSRDALMLMIGLKTERITGRLALVSFRLGRHDIYPLFIWLSLALAGIFGYITYRRGELGLIFTLAIVIGTPLAFVTLRKIISYFCDKLATWEVAKLRSRDRVEYAPRPRPRREPPSKTWLYIKAFLKARKDKVCPLITFTDSETKLDS